MSHEETKDTKDMEFKDQRIIEAIEKKISSTLAEALRDHNLVLEKKIESISANINSLENEVKGMREEQPWWELRSRAYVKG